MAAQKNQEKYAGQSSGVDYEAMYNDLYQKVKDANSARKKLLTIVQDELDTLSQHICDPDPPGCSGKKLPSATLEELALSVQAANAYKKQLLGDIAGNVKGLFQQICDPNPPGC